MLANEKFSTAPRQCEFLRYIIDKSLSGDAELLKGYAIGVDVFGRPADFDPQQDPIVRVLAGRLRKTLEHYYSTDGARDPVLIELPKSGYNPSFAFRKDFASDPEIQIADPGSIATPPTIETVKPILPSARWIKWVIAAVILVFGVSVSLYLKPDDSEHYILSAIELPTGPSIAVEPFKILDYSLSFQTGESDNQADSRLIGAGLYIEIVDKLSRFRDLVVYEAERDIALPVESLGEIPTTINRLAGTIRKTGERMVVTAILRKGLKGQVLWSKSYDEDIKNADGIVDVEAKIAADVAGVLGQPNGGVLTRSAAEMARLGHTPLKHYLCLFEFYQFSNGVSKKEFSQVKDCLLSATSDTPEFSSGWAALSWMYTHEKYDVNKQLDHSEQEMKALAAAQKAVGVNPENAVAYQYLAIARFEAGDDDGFKEAAANALRLNPNDAEILADIGSHLVQLDNSEEGKLLVEKAMRLFPGHPPWYHLPLTMYHYTRKQSKAALYHAQRFSVEDSLSSYILKTATLVQVGQIENAKLEYQKLVLKRPVFATDYVKILRNWRLPSGMNDMLLQDLATARLDQVDS